jgi:hypothetical protein
VFYTEASPNRCSATLLLDVDPVDLARGKVNANRRDQPLAPYINDRPYVASSFLSVAIAKVFHTALNGSCKELPELADTAISHYFPCRLIGV